MEDGFGMKVTRINPTPKTVPSLRLSTCSKWKKRCGESELAMAAGRVRYAKVWKLINKLLRCLHASDASLNIGFLKSPRKYCRTNIGLLKFIGDPN